MLTNDQRMRYDRHLRLEDFGERAQEKLLSGSVLVVGAGGLGSPALLYLAAAGVGRIGVIDDDIVDRSNLQRQIVHRDSDIGTAKVHSAERAIKELNPEVEVEAFDCRLDERNAREIISRFDVVLDGTDNFPTRYLINDAAYFEEVPVVHGSIYRFEGQVTVFRPPDGPCYRCLFPQAPPAGSVPSCAQAGVLGVLPGVIGTMQATEALKLLADLGEPLTGRLLRFDALTMSWSELRLARDSGCPLCGDSPGITEVAPLEELCAADAEGIVRLGPADYRGVRETGEPHLLLDVRESAEVAAGSIAGSRHIPLGDLSLRLGELQEWRSGLVVCHCQRGSRSLDAARLLSRSGFGRVACLEGGYLAWRYPDAEEPPPRRGGAAGKAPISNPRARPD